MSISATLLPPLTRLLVDLQNNLDHLTETLSQEKHLLESNAIDDLEPVLNQKDAQFRLLSEQTNQLKQLLASEALSFSFDSIEAILKDSSEQIKSQWNQFIQTLQQAQEANLVNGMLVMGMKNYNDKLLQLLTRRQNTYHPSNTGKQQPLSTREHKA